MIISMKLKEIYFNQIKSGEKIYEIRINDEKRRQLSVGDTIEFKKKPDLVEVLPAKVVDLVYFDSFNQMLQNLKVEELGFKGMTKKEVEDLYHQFYSFEEESNYGIVAIKIDNKC